MRWARQPLVLSWCRRIWGTNLSRKFRKVACGVRSHEFSINRKQHFCNTDNGWLYWTIHFSCTCGLLIRERSYLVFIPSSYSTSLRRSARGANYAWMPALGVKAGQKRTLNYSLITRAPPINCPLHKITLLTRSTSSGSVYVFRSGSVYWGRALSIPNPRRWQSGDYSDSDAQIWGIG